MNSNFSLNPAFLLIIVLVYAVVRFIMFNVDLYSNRFTYEALPHDDDIELGNVHYDNSGNLRILSNGKLSQSTRFHLQGAKGFTDDYSNKPTKIDVFFQTDNQWKVASVQVQAIELWNQKENEHFWSFEHFMPEAVKIYTQHQTEFLFNVLTILNLHEKYGQLIYEWNSITTEKIAKQMKINPTCLNVYTQREFPGTLYRLRDLHRRYYQQVIAPFLSDEGKEGDDVPNTATVGMIYIFLNDFVDQLQDGNFLKLNTFVSDMKDLFNVMTKMEHISADQIQQQQASEETNNLLLFFSSSNVEKAMKQIRPKVQEYLKLRQHDIFDEDYMMNIFYSIHANLKRYL